MNSIPSALVRAPRFSMPPAPAQTGDGNEWVTGRCWLYCLREGVQVIWIGPVQVVGAEAPMYGCGPCITTLTDLLWDSLLRKDRPAARAVS